MKLSSIHWKDSAWLLPSLALAAVWCGFVSANWGRDFLILGAPLSLMAWGVAVIWGKSRTTDPLNKMPASNTQTGDVLRLQVFQELAHDIKTPLTTIRYLLDTLQEDLKGSSLQETATLAATEVVYFQKLVEDLFLLSQLNHNPGMTISKKTIFPLEILESEISQVRGIREAQGKAIRIQMPENMGEEVLIFGEPYLIRRLFRNALDNAITHAKSQIDIAVAWKQSSLCEVVFRDDGEGFSPDAIAKFGTRRRKRFIDFEKHQKISLGLGSVILQSIARAFGGDASVSNWMNPEGSLGGGQLKLSFRATSPRTSG